MKVEVYNNVSEDLPLIRHYSNDDSTKLTMTQHNDSTKLTANFGFPPGHRERICSFVQEVRAEVNARSTNETSKEKPFQLNAQKV